MKKRLLCLALILCLTCSIVFAACTDTKAQAALDALSIPQEGKQQTASFELPGKAGDYTLTWTADPSASLTLTPVGDKWLAEPVRGTTDVTVKLTATAGKASRTFTIVVPKATDPVSDAINGYMFALQGEEVTAPFDLPKQIKGIDVTWESSNTTALSIADQGTKYVATPTRGDETVNVTLTLKSGSVTRSDMFVLVPGIDITTIRDNFRFVQQGLTVNADFDLETEFTYEGRKATIAWEVTKGSEYVSVSADNDKCILNASAIGDEARDVALKATFSYNGKTTEKVFNFKVAQPVDHVVMMHEYYTAAVNTKLPDFQFEGYVAAFGQNYKNGTNVALYLVDLNGCHGIYAYSTSLASSGDLNNIMRVGAHVIVTGGTAGYVDVYNGLRQVRGGVVTLLDNDHDATYMDGKVYAVDEDVIGDLPALQYHTGALVSLTNWKVKEVKTDTTKKSGTVLVLEKGGKTINIGYSNYMEGSYTSSADGDANKDETLKAMLTKCKEFAVGDYVNVKGLLSNYNGWQLLPRSAADITAGTEQAAGTNGTNAKAAIAAIEAAIEAAHIDSTVVTTTTASLPQLVSGATIRYDVRGGNTVAVQHGSNPSDNATLTITPVTVAESVWVQATITVGEDFSTTYLFKVTSEALSNQAIVEKVVKDLADAFETTIEKADDPIDLTTTTAFDGVTVTWEVDKTKGEFSLLSIANNKLTVTLPTDADKTAYIIVKAELSGATDEKEIQLTLKKIDNSIIKLTVDTIGLKSQSYSDKTNATTATVNGLEIAYIGLGNYGSGIQMNGSYNSRLYTSKGVATGKIIEKIELTYNHAAGQTSAAEGLTISFDANTSFAKDVQKLVFEVVAKGSPNKTYTITPNGNWNFVDIKYSAAQYAQYWESIVIYLKDGTPDEGTAAPSHTCNDVCGICKKCTTECQDEVCNAKCPGHAPTDAFTKVEKTSAPVGQFKLAMWMATTDGGKWLYATGKLTSNGYYFAATENAAQADTLTIEDRGDGKYAIKNSEGKYLEMYKTTTNYYNSRLVDSVESLENLWSWNSDLGIFTADLGGAVYYLGSYASNAELRPTAITRISDTSVIDKTQFVAYFGNVKAD